MSYVVRQNPSPMFWEGRYGRTVKEIFIHHAATTDFDGIGQTFKNKEVSAHYGVGSNNNVDQYVDEANTAWHCGVGERNLDSIGIENVNESGAPDWNVSDSTFNTLVELVHDIASRHGLLPLKVGENLFGHKDVYDTACPMKLYPRLHELADAVNGNTATGPHEVAVPPKGDSGVDQILHVGEHFVFDKTYTVDGLAQVGGIWQVQTNELCPSGFTWDDNGIPVMPLVEVAGGVGNSSDQVLQVGSKYTIPGTYTVLNLGYSNGMWLAQVDIQGWKLWVDINTVTEVQ